ncbi:MAG: zinc protease [Pirellulaceae bacterium]|nr:MAG: zinc protease [Pirellulaceae bacterium]
MPEAIHCTCLDNGLVILGERMPWLESVAVGLHVPAGCIYDPADKVGLAHLVGEMVQRGCGPRDSRQFLEALELLGANYGGAAGLAHASFRATLLADNLDALLPIFADLVRRPHLPADQFEDARQTALQAIQAREDDFAEQAMNQLERLHFGDPWGRDELGTRQAVLSLRYEDVVEFYQRCYGPRNCIISVAGQFQWEHLVEKIGELFGDWKPQEPPRLESKAGKRGYEHLERPTQQTHIALAADAVAYRDADYFLARAAVGVLSDGASSRLFVEVREKRGLCYTVAARCQSTLDEGAVLCYAGTTTERAQQTWDLLVEELERLAEGVTAEEWSRVKAKIKSAIVMLQESSSARSSNLASDYYHRGKAFSIEELKHILDNITVDQINDYLKRRPPRIRSAVSVGAQRLEVRRAIP